MNRYLAVKRTKNNNPLIIIFCVSILSIFIATSCPGQLWSPYPLIFPFMPMFYPFNPFPALSSPVITPVGPLLTTYVPNLPLLGRNANATIIIILNQTANTITASAPLGTLNLTSSAIVPLSLFLAL